jgi:DNA polymerase-3 subunit delta
VAAVTVLRALQTHFRRLHSVQSARKSGADMKTAMDALQPKIFFKYEQSFQAQLQRWDFGRLQKVMTRLSDLEAQTKTTGAPVETLCAQAILSLSAA